MVATIRIADADFGLGDVTATGGTIKRNISDKLGEIVSVRDYGAVGDGTTDDYAAFVAAAGAAKSLNPGLGHGTVFIPAGRIFKLASSIDLTGVNILSEGVITTPDGVVVDVGATAVSGVPKSIRINAIWNGSSFSKNTTPNLRIVGAKHLILEIGRCPWIQLVADNDDADVQKRSIAYCRIIFGLCDQLDLIGNNGGWINENYFFGRLLQLNLSSTGATRYQHNTNNFDCVLEESTITLSQARGNTITARLEGTNVITCGAESIANRIIQTYTASNIENALQEGVQATITDSGVSNSFYHRAVNDFQWAKTLNVDFISSVASFTFFDASEKQYVKAGDVVCFDIHQSGIWRPCIEGYDSSGDLITSEWGFSSVGWSVWDGTANNHTTSVNKDAGKLFGRITSASVVAVRFRARAGSSGPHTGAGVSGYLLSRRNE